MKKIPRDSKIAKRGSFFSPWEFGKRPFICVCMCLYHIMDMSSQRKESWSSYIFFSASCKLWLKEIALRQQQQENNTHQGQICRASVSDPSMVEWTLQVLVRINDMEPEVSWLVCEARFPGSFTKCSEQKGQKEHNPFRSPTPTVVRLQFLIHEGRWAKILNVSI